MITTTFAIRSLSGELSRLAIRHRSIFASLVDTGCHRELSENALITNTVAIYSLSDELSRLALSSTRSRICRAPSRHAGTRSASSRWVNCTPAAMRPPVISPMPVVPVMWKPGSDINSDIERMDH